MKNFAKHRDIMIERHLKTRGIRKPVVFPYDGIVVTVGAAAVPQPLKERLALGGRILIPAGSGRTRELARIRRTAEDRYAEEDLLSVRFVSLVGAQS